MSFIRSFPAVTTPEANTIILGSAPGKASLNAGQYYAHPRNQFWPIMTTIVSFPLASSYQTKLRELCLARIALWDVVKTCERPGSMDANIDKHSVTPNDFASLLSSSPSIERVLFNGAAAERLFREYVLETIPTAKLAFKTLPSTSPAYASMSFENKLKAWKSGISIWTP